MGSSSDHDSVLPMQPASGFARSRRSHKQNNNNNSPTVAQTKEYIMNMSIDVSMPLLSSEEIELENDHNNNNENNNNRSSTSSGRNDGTPRRSLARSAPMPTLYHRRLVEHPMETAIGILRQQGFPAGLARELVESKTAFPLRYWVIDNSGSMLTPDGQDLRSMMTPTTTTTVTAAAATALRHILQEVHHNNNNHNAQQLLYSELTKTSPSHPLTTVSCTRWSELQSTVTYHAELAALLQCTTVFRLLNHPGGRVGPREFVIAEERTKNNNNPAAATTMIMDPTIQHELQLAKSVIQNTTPKGATPLTAHLLEIRQRVESMKDVLTESGQMVVIILATDGIPTNEYGDCTEDEQQEFIMNMKLLQALPVWVVIRLCTNDPEVVQYYNDLDAMLELPLEVIDDYFHEAAEIEQFNPWLNYSLCLHRCREMGYRHRIFDLLDERLLNKDELLEFITLLFGIQQSSRSSLPNVHLQWNEFLSHVSKLLDMEGGGGGTNHFSKKNHSNPNGEMARPWIDLKQLDKCYKNYSNTTARIRQQQQQPNQPHNSKRRRGLMGGGTGGGLFRRNKN